ncbi:MAG TPA: GNAT family N-acetyltransferase [Salinisphaeraceae bacterium]|nr:GNAT family N-acetyltransferase [Salinisphaeraceae bacterium]
MNQFTTHFVTAADQADWRPLFDGYAEFYQTRMNDAIADAVWGWLLDPEHVLEGLLVRDAQQQAIGMMHFRSCPRPLSGCDMGFVDDLFVTPAARGSGAADALFDRLGDIATERGWPVVRWLTQHFNVRGRGMYDRYTSGPSDFIMYQWDSY